MNLFSERQASRITRSEGGLVAVHGFAVLCSGKNNELGTGHESCKLLDIQTYMYYRLESFFDLAGIDVWRAIYVLHVMKEEVRIGKGGKESMFPNEICV